ncbi:MAG TPA: asparagine synthase (glutamine-hydrolyzing) [Bacteroidales bacterium]|jgi:asparagine synthase (glutamine-hydrolysing)|nr:asparagine synthase (glutamine-hydrolyzing) [Bacteroidales bacterium]
MSGICGIIKFDGNSPEKDKVISMMQRQKHRGPDDEGVFLDKSVGLGFVRLTATDSGELSHQPMFDDTGNYVIVHNGTIYNYIELREELIDKGIKFKSNSDTEVLLKMYIEYGKDCLDRLNGIFAFVIFNKRSNTVFGARDRFGVKPLYYFHDKEQFIFASEIPPILDVYGWENKPNELVIYEYLLHNRTDQTENTFFDGIKKLQHGHYFDIKDNHFTIKRWYNVADKIKECDGNADNYKELLVDAVKLRLRGNFPVGICLSGGLDSSAITSIIYRELSNTKVHTFSAIYNKGEHGDESDFINLYREELQNMHFITPDSSMLLSNLDHFIHIHAEPIPSTSSFAQYCVMSVAKNNVVATIDGQGADEALAGYHYFFGFYFKELLKQAKFGRLLREISQYLKKHNSIDGLKYLVYFLLPSFLKNKVSTFEKSYLNKDFVHRVASSGKNLIVNELYSSNNLNEALINHFEYKLEHLLKWGDRNSMAFSLESRTPFLDHRLVEYTLSMPSRCKIRNGETKYILRQVMKGLLPEPIRKRKDKIGFETPQDEWFRTPDFQALINEILNSESFQNRGFIYSKKALDLYSKHLKKEINISKEIWKWIHLELWFREFIDKK